MTTTQTIPVPTERVVPTGAAVWLDGQHAVIARTGRDGRIATIDLDRGVDTEASYLARVVHAVGDRERVLILGPSAPRLALEREYVAIFRRPDRLIDMEPADAVVPQDLVDRLTVLVS